MITLLSSSSSPIFAVVLSDQPPSPLIDRFLQSLTDNPVHFTDNSTVPRQESRANIFLPSLFDSKAHPLSIQPEESESILSSPRRQSFHSTALRALTQDARASLSQPKKFQNNQQVSTQKGRESYLQRSKSVRRPRLNPCLPYNLTNGFCFGRLYPGIIKGRSILFRILFYQHRDFWYL